MPLVVDLDLHLRHEVCLDLVADLPSTVVVDRDFHTHGQSWVEVVEERRNWVQGERMQHMASCWQKVHWVTPFAIDMYHCDEVVRQRSWVLRPPRLVYVVLGWLAVIMQHGQERES